MTSCRILLSDRVLIHNKTVIVIVWMCVCVSVLCCSLQENAIGNEGVIFLAEALKTNTSLRTLWLAFDC